MLNLNILIAAGGTGGHIYPGIAVGEALQAQGHQVTMCFSGLRPAEKKAAASWKGSIFFSGARTMRHLFANIVATIRCVLHYRKDRPDYIFATGGYSILPPILAARMMNIPVILHEANAFPGKAIRFFTKHFKIKSIAVSFEETLATLPNVRAVYSGFPVRRELVDRVRLAREQKTPNDTFTLLITGGSQGAHWINETLAEALCRIARKGADDLRVIHQCGTADLESLVRVYAESNVQAEVYDYILDMGDAYARADVVFARAGAGTCFEIAACGIPAVFIPLPTAMDDHQTKNAAKLVSVGGALCYQQSSAAVKDFIALILQLRSDPEVLDAMQKALLTVDQPQALETIVSEITS